MQTVVKSLLHAQLLGKCLPLEAGLPNLLPKSYQRGFEEAGGEWALWQ